MDSLPDTDADSGSGTGGEAAVPAMQDWRERTELLLGKEGLREVNALSYGGAHYLYDSLLATGLFEPVFDRPFLKEFVLKSSLPAAELQQALCEGGFFAALATEEGYLSFCATEKRTREEIDALVACIKDFAHKMHERK